MGAAVNNPKAGRSGILASRGCLIGIGLGLVGLAGVIFLILSAASPSWFPFTFFKPFRQVTGAVVLYEGGDGQAADIAIFNEPPGVTIEDNRGSRPSSVPVYLSYTSDDSVEESGGREAIWEVEIGRTQTESGLPETNFTAGNGAIYLAADDKLRALSDLDGELLWESRLSDLVEERCHGCLKIVNDRLIVLTIDNVIQVFEVNSGRELWSARLNEDSPKYSEDGRIAFETFGNLIAILDDVVVDDGSRDAVVFYDLETGDIVRHLQPTCSDWPVIDLAIADPASEQIFFVDEGIGLEQTCVESWDPISGDLNWQIMSEQSISLEFAVRDMMSTDIPADHVVYGSRNIYLAGDNLMEELDGQVMAIERDGGGVHRLLEETDYELSPLAESGEILAVHARRTRGSERAEIWGVDTDSGEIMWQKVLDAADRLGVDGFGREVWDTYLSPHGLMVMQVFPDGGRIEIQRLDMETGEVLEEGETEIGGFSILVRSSDWTNSAAYFVINRDFYTLDYESLELDEDWP